MPTLHEFRLKELDLNDYHKFTYYTNKTEYFTGLWASTFTYMWSLSRLKKIKVVWRILDGMISIFVLTRERFLYVWCLPFGKGDSTHVLNVLTKSMRLCHSWNSIHNQHRYSYVHLVNEKQLDFLKTAPKFENEIIYKKYKSKEIFWSISKIIQLTGSEYSEVRALRNKFLRNYSNISFRKYMPTDFKDVLALKTIWNTTSGQKYNKITDQHLFEQVFLNYEILKERIFVATFDGKVIGFVTGAILPNSLSWGCLAKAHPNYKGLSEYLYTEFVQALYEEDPTISLLNVGSDNNHEGLRRFKQKFRPVAQLELYKLRLKNI